MSVKLQDYEQLNTVTRPRSATDVLNDTATSGDGASRYAKYKRKMSSRSAKSEGQVDGGHREK